MPFISVQSIYKRVAAVVASIFWRTTNYLFDHTRASLVGRPVISGDGIWMVTSSGGSYAGSGPPAFRTSVRVYKRTGGIGAPWIFIQEIIPPGLSDEARFSGIGMDGTTMSKDGTRIFIENETGTGIYVFSRSGDVWSYEATIPLSTEQPYIFKPSNFDTTAGIDATNDIITTATVHDFHWESIVRYDKDGGTANIGLIETDQYYWARPPMVFFSNTSVNTTTHYITATDHPFPTGSPIRMIATGTDPDKITALTEYTVYYSRSLASNQFAIYPTATDATNDTNRISLTYTGTWSSSSWSIQSADRVVLYPTQVDAQNQTNRIQLTSTGAETHILYQGSRYYNGYTNGFQPRIHTNTAGSRICTANTKEGCLATITVWDRSGISWSESARIPVRNTNAIDWDVAGSYWQIGYNDSYITAVEDAICMSGDGNTITAGSSTDGAVYAAYTGVTSFTFVASNPLYGNKPTVEIAGSLTWDRIRPGAKFSIEKYPTPSPVDGRYTVSAVETPTIISIDTVLSSGTITDFTDNPATVYLEFDSMFAHVFHYNGSNWIEDAEFVSPSAIPSDAREFGQNAAAVNFDGTVVAIGDVGYPAGSDYGRIYIFEKVASVWSHADTLIGDPDVYQRLGSDIAITPDGNTIVAGAPWYSIDPSNTSSLPYPYPETYLTQLLPTPPYRYAVALETYDYLDTYAVGKVYLFNRTSTGSPYTITNSTYPVDNHTYGLYFGNGVSITDDGKTVAIAAPETPLTNYEGPVVEPLDWAAMEVGSVRVWEEIVAVENTEPRYQAYYLESEWPLFYSGYAKRQQLSSDGTTLAVGYMDRADIDIYTTLDNGVTWSLPYTIKIEGAMVSYQFSLNSDGSKIAILIDTEAFYDIQVVTFEKVGDDWIRRDTLVPPQLLDATVGAPWYEPTYYGSFGGRLWDYNSAVIPQCGMNMSADGSTLFITHFMFGVNDGPTIYFNSGTDVDTANDHLVFTYPHSFETGEYVRYLRWGFPNANIGLTNGNYYYARVVDKYRISLHSSFANANSGASKINLTAAGTQKQSISSADNRSEIRVYSWNTGTNTWNEENTHAMKVRVATSSSLTNAGCLDFGYHMSSSADGNIVVATTSFQRKAYSISDPTSGDKQAQLFVYERSPAPSTFTPEWVTVVTGGTGYAVNDILTVVGGTPSASAMTIRVTNVLTGVITSAIVETASTYTDIFSIIEDCAVTGGTGSGATLRVWWNGARYRISTATIAAGGSNYQLYDNVSLAGGTPEGTVDPATNLTFFNITALSGTAASTISLQSNQIYTSIPDPNSPAATTSDNGTGLTLNIVWKSAIQQPEKGYLWKLVQKTQEFWSAETIQDSSFTAQTPLESTYGETPVAMSADGSVIAMAHNSYQHVYIFERGPQTQNAIHWTTSLWSPTPLQRTEFGLFNSVSVSADGNTIAIGASKTEGTGYENVGAVYVYKKINSNWKLVTTVSCPCQSYGEEFGYSTSLNNDGSILTVGSIQRIRNTVDVPVWSDTPGGRVDVYLTTTPGYEIGCALDYASTEHNEEALTVNPSVSKPYMRIGDSVDMISDGQRCIVGGAETCVYSNLSLDGNWVLEQNLIPSAMSIDNRIRAEYGCAVKLNQSNHDLAFVSAPRTTVSGNVNAGAVYVFERSGTTWTLRDTITAAVPAANAYFGADIGINHLGTVLAVSTRAIGSGSTGEAYVFRYIGSSWIETKIIPPHTQIDSGAVACIEAPFGNLASVAFGGRDATGQARVYIYSVDLTTGIATLGHTYIGGLKDPTPIPFDITNIADDPDYLYNYGGTGYISIITTDVSHGFSRGEAVQYTRGAGAVENLLGLEEPETFSSSRYWVYPVSSTELRLIPTREGTYIGPGNVGAENFPPGSATGAETHYLIPLKKYSAGSEKGTLSFGWTGENKLFLAIGDPTASDTYGDSTLGRVDILSSINAANFAAGPWTHIQTILPPNIGFTVNLSESQYSPDIRFGSNVYFTGYDLAISSTNYTEMRTRYYWGFRTTFAGGAWIYQKLADDQWRKYIDLIPADQNMQYFKSVAISSNNTYAVLGGPYFFHPNSEEGEIPIITFDTDATGVVSNATLVSGGTNQWTFPGMYFDRERWNHRISPTFSSDPGFGGTRAVFEYDIDIITGSMSNLTIAYPGIGYTPNLTNQLMVTTFGSYEVGEWMTHLDKPQVGQAKILNRVANQPETFAQFSLVNTFNAPAPGFFWGTNAHMSRDGDVIAVAGYSTTVDMYRRVLGTWSLEDTIDLSPYLGIRLANYDPSQIHINDNGTRMVVATEFDFFTFDYITGTWTFVDAGCPIPGNYLDSRYLSGDGTRYFIGLDYSGIAVYQWNASLYSTMGDSVNGGTDDTAYFDGVGDNGTFTVGSGYSVNDVIILSDGSQVKVTGIGGTGDVTFFVFVRTSNTTLGSGPFTSGATLTQTSVDPAGGTGFSITMGTNNQSHWCEEDIIGRCIVTEVSIDSAGTGYTLGDQLTISGVIGNYSTSGIYNEQAVVQVTSVGGSGEITGLSIINSGDYLNYSIDIYFLQSNPRSLVGGTGTGATVIAYGRNVIDECDYQGYANEYPYRIVSSATGSVLGASAGRWTLAADPEYAMSPSAITYSRTGSDYVLQQISIATWNTGQGTTNQNHNIAMSADGTKMCVTNSSESCVYVFEFDGTHWNGKGIASCGQDWNLDYNTMENGISGDYALDISNDGETIVAQWENYDRIVVWKWINGEYKISQLILAPTPVFSDYGYKIRLSGDGTRLMVTTPSEEQLYIYEIP